MPDSTELWRKYKQKADQNARDEIIKSYAYLAKYVVDRMSFRPNAVTSYDDLLGHAIIGLIDAVEKFDPSRDVKFETYATVRIKGAVIDAIRTLDWIPRSVRASETQLRRVYAKLEARLGRPAEDAEVAEEMGVDIGRFNETLADVAHAALVSLEEVLVDGDEPLGGVSGSSPDDDPSLAVEFGERKRLLARSIRDLPEREKLVISLYYRDGLTLKEIAAVLGVGESRACQLHSKATVRLHGKLARHAELLLAA